MPTLRWHCPRSSLFSVWHYCNASWDLGIFCCVLWVNEDKGDSQIKELALLWDSWTNANMQKKHTSLPGCLFISYKISIIHFEIKLCVIMNDKSLQEIYSASWLWRHRSAETGTSLTSTGIFSTVSCYVPAEWWLARTMNVQRELSSLHAGRRAQCGGHWDRQTSTLGERMNESLGSNFYS